MTVAFVLIVVEISVRFQSAFGELWVSWHFSNHQGRRVECEASAFCPFCFAHWKYENWTTVAFVYFWWGLNEMSVFFRWALWKLRFFTSPGTKGEMRSTIFRVFLLLAYWRYEIWMTVAFVNFRWGLDESAILSRWALRKLRFPTWSGTRGGMRSTVFSMFLCVSILKEMRTEWLSHLLIFGEVSMRFQSAVGEFWLSWDSSQHQ